jgi:ABC-type transport system involved in multi-copper enzyme maturation permease subunit
MSGTLIIARFTYLEQLRSKVFWILMIIPLVINIIFCGVGYWHLNHDKDSLENEVMRTYMEGGGEFPRGQNDSLGRNHAGRVMGEDSSSSEFDLYKDQLIATFIGTIISIFIIYPLYIFFGNLLVIFSGVGIMSPELEKRSIYTLISKPLSRGMIFLGKLLGIIAVMFTFSLVLLLFTELLLMASGAGFYRGLFPAFAVGFISFLIFAGVSLLFSTLFRPVPASVISLILLSWSSAGAVTIAEVLTKEVFKFGKWANIFIYLLPQQRLIGRFANNFNIDKYQKMFLGGLPEEFREFGALKLITDNPAVLIQPLIWLIIIMIIGFAYFSRKEFD